ncbi:MAG: peptidase M22 [Ruminococcaceae bacterium]|nr:peptidase M22 [Oscillospiraceae bacterium]
MNTCFVGIDTSNYTTSCAACDGEGNVFANVRIPLPVAEGERGLRQSDAVFAHVKNLPVAMQQLRETIRGKEILAVGVSESPRRCAGSYMPCFLSGIAAAQSFAAPIDLPVYRFAHQEGHIMAALYSAGKTDLTNRELLAFHVSGGTTEVLHVQPAEVGFSVSVLGGGADLHAGQAIDRIGVMMGLKFPCGKEMEQFAATYTGELPPVRVSVKGIDCHLSGLENLAGKLWTQTGDRALVSAFVLEFLAKTLEKMTKGADERYPGLPIVYAGGVMSNRFLQSRLSKRKETYFANPEFSADNAAGIALLCRRTFLI